jgi:hypothetical protein
LGTKIAIGDPVAKTDIHAHRDPKSMAFIYAICDQFAMSLASLASNCRTGVPLEGARRRSGSPAWATNHEYVQIWL